MNIYELEKKATPGPWKVSSGLGGSLSCHGECPIRDDVTAYVS